MEFNLYSIIIGFLFGIVGFGAWKYGRQSQSERHMLLAVALMGYSYFISDVWISLLVGAVLTVLLFWP